MTGIYVTNFAMNVSQHPIAFLGFVLILASILVGYFLCRFEIEHVGERQTLSEKGEENVQVPETSNQKLFTTGYYPLGLFRIPFVAIHGDILGGAFVACRGLQIALFLPVIALASQLLTSALITRNGNKDGSNIHDICKSLVFVILALSSVSSLYTIFTARFLSCFGPSPSQYSSVPRIIRLLMVAFFDSVVAAALSFSNAYFTATSDSAPCCNSTLATVAATFRHTGLSEEELLGKFLTFNSVESNCWNIKVLGALVTVESLLLCMSSLASMAQSVQWYAEFFAEEETEGLLRVGEIEVVEVKGNGEIQV